MNQPVSQFKHILLASHGTKGAIAAENKALQLCAPNGTIDHLIVIPDFWQSMTGDDWLNNGTVRDQFRDYLSQELAQAIDRQCNRLNLKMTAHQLTYGCITLFGKPDQALLQQADTCAYDLIVIGSRRPKNILSSKNMLGLRSIMLTKKVTQLLQRTLLIAAYPAQVAAE